MSTSDYKNITDMAMNDVSELERKGLTYGDSWKARGGVGAFMMLARKWDRIENIVRGRKWDVLDAGTDNAGDMMDDIADLRRYLFLVEDEVNRLRGQKVKGQENAYFDPFGSRGKEARASPGYVYQDHHRRFFREP